MAAVNGNLKGGGAGSFAYEGHVITVFIKVHGFI